MHDTRKKVHFLSLRHPSTNHQDKSCGGGVRMKNMKKNLVSIEKECTFAPDFERRNHLQDRGVAQLASALAWGARGRKFESSRPDNDGKEKRYSLYLFFVLWV